MHRHGLRSDIPSEFIRETDLIRTICERYPDFSDIRHFLYSRMSDNGLISFRWKFHFNRVLQIGWAGKNLLILQRLNLGGMKIPASFPVTWGKAANSIPFDHDGEAMMSGEAARELWAEVIGQSERDTKP